MYVFPTSFVGLSTNRVRVIGAPSTQAAPRPVGPSPRPQPPRLPPPRGRAGPPPLRRPDAAGRAQPGGRGLAGRARRGRP